MRSLRQFWSMRRINDDRVTLVRLGPLRLWLARADKEWGFAVEYGEVTQIMDIAQVPEDVVPQHLEWTNSLFKEAPREFCLRPVFPDRPLVTRPEFPTIIPHGETGNFIIPFPVFIQIILSHGSAETVLGTIPSRQLSDTWFGTRTEGVLCYALPFSAQKDYSGIQPFPHQVICPVEIRNQAADFLSFEKFCLRPEYETLYCGDTHLWGSPVHITHHGPFKGTQVQYRRSAPGFEPNLMELVKARKREDSPFRLLTFGTGFKHDTIFGS